MDNSIEEQPKEKIARRVMHPTRKYFLPRVGKEVDEKGLKAAIEEDEKDNDNAEVSED